MGGVDLGDAEQARAWVDAAVATYDGIDVLYNNASTQRFGALDELSIEDWDFTMRNELDLVYYTVRAAWPHLKAYGGGSIINVGSIAALRGVEFMPQNAHSTAKGGVIALTLQLVVEGGPHGIRANVISPGMTETPNTAPMLADPPERFRTRRPRPDPARPGRAARGHRQRRDLPGLRRVLVDQRHQHRHRRRRLGPRLSPTHSQGEKHMRGNLNPYGITHLRHVDLAVPDYDTQRSFYTETWGLTEVGTDGDLSYLAAEGSPEQYVIRLRKDADKRMDLISFGADSAASVDALAQKLGTEGITLVSEPGELQTAGGGYGFRFFDVDGRTIEISSDVATRQHRAIEEGEAVPVRISHAVMNSNDPNRTRDFYEKTLGFMLSDTLWGEHMGEMMHFMRCNDWHHSLAIARGPHTSVHHVSFEMRGLDEYMRGTGRVMRAGIKKIWGPGRHNAGNNTFSYFLDPSGNTMEYTTELEKIETDPWHPSVYDIADPMTQDQWGTADPMSEIIARDSFNDPDKGVFVAPPV